MVQSRVVVKIVTNDFIYNPKMHQYSRVEQ